MTTEYNNEVYFFFPLILVTNHTPGTTHSLAVSLSLVVYKVETWSENTVSKVCTYSPYSIIYANRWRPSRTHRPVWYYLHRLLIFLKIIENNQLLTGSHPPSFNTSILQQLTQGFPLFITFRLAAAPWIVALQRVSLSPLLFILALHALRKSEETELDEGRVVIISGRGQAATGASYRLCNSSESILLTSYRTRSYGSITCVQRLPDLSTHLDSRLPSNCSSPTLTSVIGLTKEKNWLGMMVTEMEKCNYRRNRAMSVKRCRQSDAQSIR